MSWLRAVLGKLLDGFRLDDPKTTTSGRQVTPKVTVSIEKSEYRHPKKDASIEFAVLGSPCRVDYFSDWPYLKTITDPEDRWNDPRRWVDVVFRGERYGYAWDVGCWTHSAAGLEEKDQIEYTLCQHFGTLVTNLAPGSIKTTNRQSFDGKYLIHGRTSEALISAQFRHGGYIVDLDFDGQKGRYDARAGKISFPVKLKPAEPAVLSWVETEYSTLRPLKGALP